MQFLLKRIFFCTIILLSLLHSSCDLIWKDQGPQYWYKVQNNTEEAIQVTFEADGNIYGNRVVQWSIAPGETFNIWGYSGSKEEGSVIDFEKSQPRMSQFKKLEIKGLITLQSAKTNFNSPKNWQYKKIKAYEKPLIP